MLRLLPSLLFELCDIIAYTMFKEQDKPKDAKDLWAMVTKSLKCNMYDEIK